MFEPTADFGHKAMRVVFTLTGNVPRTVDGAATAAAEGGEASRDG